MPYSEHLAAPLRAKLTDLSLPNAASLPPKKKA